MIPYFWVVSHSVWCKMVARYINVLNGWMRWPTQNINGWMDGWIEMTDRYRTPKSFYLGATVKERKKSREGIEWGLRMRASEEKPPPSATYALNIGIKRPPRGRGGGSFGTIRVSTPRYVSAGRKSHGCRASISLLFLTSARPSLWGTGAAALLPVWEMLGAGREPLNGEGTCLAKDCLVGFSAVLRCSSSPVPLMLIAPVSHLLFPG